MCTSPKSKTTAIDSRSIVKYPIENMGKTQNKTKKQIQRRGKGCVLIPARQQHLHSGVGFILERNGY